MIFDASVFLVRFVRPGLLILAVILVLVVIVVLSNELGLIRRLVYFPREVTGWPVVGNDIRIEIARGRRTARGLLSRSGGRLVVFFHGNGSLINDIAYVAGEFYRAGFDTLLVEYPGYGISYGQRLTEGTIYADSQAVLNHVIEQYGYRSDDCVLFGRSLGTGVAAELAANGFGARLVLVSPYTSLPGVAHQKVVPVLPYLVMADRFATIRKAPGIGIPVRLMHGTDDQLIPFQMAIHLLDVFPNATLCSLEGADHNNVFQYIDAAGWQELFGFCNER
jgi:pimeloyl-ACP methyl ester carboxylesterase